MTNQLFIRQYTSLLLRNAFPNVEPGYIDTFVSALCECSNDLSAYKIHLRDFLITSRENAGNGESNGSAIVGNHGAKNEDLFQDDKEAEAEKLRQLEREKAQNVPGMLKP